MTEIVTALFLLISGVIFTHRLHFLNPNVFLRAALTPFHHKKHSGKGISPFSALCTSLGGCVGTGNIIGVITCIMLGGKGSIFWIWVCGFLSISTKYTEIYLASKTKSSYRSGSPMHYCCEYLGKTGKIIGFVWCILCAICALCSGASVQANAISDAASCLFDTHISKIQVRIICGLVLMSVTILIISRGLKRVSRISAVLVPIACIAYVGICVYCIICSGKSIFEVLSVIVHDAVSPIALLSGGVTYSVLRSVRLGVSRGIFSNEAGMGTSPLALSASDLSPYEQAGMGIWEVIIDTFIICTCTALTVLCCVPDIQCMSSPTDIMILALSSCFNHSFCKVFLALVIALFAYTSVLGWSFYGSYCIEILTNKNMLLSVMYKAFFCVMLFCGCLFPLGVIWDLAATFNMVLAVPNVTAMLIITGKKQKTATSSHGLFNH